MSSGGAGLQHLANCVMSESTPTTSTPPGERLGCLRGFFSQGLDTNVRHHGFELRYALIDGSTTTPAVGLRASTTQLTNVDNLNIDTKGLDISVSKGFVMFTPYAGAGVVRVSGETSGLRSSTTLNKFCVGVGMILLALNVNIEYDKTGDMPSYSAKLGLRF